MTNIKLSKRLSVIASLVPENAVIADIGCDHALLDIYLSKKNIIKKSFAIDITKGALNQADKNIKLYNAKNIETRLSDGFEKIDIKDISIIDITKQYINYITALEKMDLEIASEFITMASKLLEIKSRYLLYKQKDNNEVEDPRLELMEKLEEYKKFKLASQDLKDNITYVDDLYYRKKEEIIIDDSMNIDDISIDAIKNILPYILKVKSEDNKPHKDEKLDKIVRGRIVPVEEKIAYIREIISRDNEVSFIKVIENVDKDEVIATFLSVLELIKSREIVVYQDLFFDDILIKKNLES